MTLLTFSLVRSNNDFGGADVTMRSNVQLEHIDEFAEIFGYFLLAAGFHPDNVNEALACREEYLDRPTSPFSKDSNLDIDEALLDPYPATEDYNEQEIPVP